MATAGAWSTLRPHLPPALLSALTHTLNLPTMTPVQAAAIPPLLTCKDVCVDAETGSGKTLSYLIPIAHALLTSSPFPPPSPSVRFLIITPTRELATQVHAVATALFAALPHSLTPALLIGGTPTAAIPSSPASSLPRRDLRVVVATPGRLAAELSQRRLHVAKLSLLVLDEADRLLDMGFAVALTDILTRLPRQRRTGIYSATQTAQVDALARAGLRNPVRVAVRVAGRENAVGEEGAETGVVKRRRTPASLECSFRFVPAREKLARLLQLVGREEGGSSGKFIVYFLTCACVDYYMRLPLREMAAVYGGGIVGGKGEGTGGGRFVGLHGKMSQMKRERAMAKFAASENGVLLCTDVAARGLDIADVDCVVQFDAPQDPDAYIHRVGRAARLGREGKAVIFLMPCEDAYVEFLKVRKCPVKEWEEQGGEAEAEGVAEAVAEGGEEREEKEEDAVSKRVRKRVREVTLKDRAVMEAGEKAFLSYIRAYKEHKCRVLLKLEEIDIGSVADSFGLLRMPRFHEFKRLRKKIVWQKEAEVKVRDVAFKDKIRERRRQELIKEAVANRLERREALQAKSKKVKKRKRKPADDDDRRTRKQHRKVSDATPFHAEDTEDDFSLEAMQLRKLKRGKLSHAAFDRSAGYHTALSD